MILEKNFVLQEGGLKQESSLCGFSVKYYLQQLFVNENGLTYYLQQAYFLMNPSQEELPPRVGKAENHCRNFFKLT